ncbi:MAG: hypothetical protein HY700_06445 [Gemmatimonadetes bacterium]|nr:hypothetical protein [Gemmatimonadota bacterium]
MNPFQPLINLLVLMSALSIAAERIANAIKLNSPTLREVLLSTREEKDRERRIGHRVLLISVLLALVLKADLFQILANLDAPWDTLGWTPGPPTGLLHTLNTIAGMVLTGIALGFGSKFWHDVLDIVYRTRRRAPETGTRRSLMRLQ